MTNGNSNSGTTKRRKGIVRGSKPKGRVPGRKNRGVDGAVDGVAVADGRTVAELLDTATVNGSGVEPGTEPVAEPDGNAVDNGSGRVDRRRRRGSGRGSGRGGRNRSARTAEASDGSATAASEPAGSEQPETFGEEVDPEQVTLGDLFGVGGGEKFSIEKSVAELIGFIFEIPALSGLGEHWRLQQKEKAAIGKAFKNWFDSLSKKEKAWIEDLLMKRAPIVGLIGTIGLTSWWRVKLTMELVRAKNATRKTNARTAGAAQNQADNAYERNGNGVGVGYENPAYGRSTIDEWFVKNYG